MGMPETIQFGLIGLVTASAAVICLRKKASVISIVFGICTIPFIFLSGYNWRLALLDSGKNVAWLGFSEYPFAPIILIVLLVMALMSIIRSVLRLSKKVS